jgi:hypothetical protein
VGGCAGEVMEKVVSCQLSVVGSVSRIETSRRKKRSRMAVRGAFMNRSYQLDAFSSQFSGPGIAIETDN